MCGIPQGLTASRGGYPGPRDAVPPQPSPAARVQPDRDRGQAPPTWLHKQERRKELKVGRRTSPHRQSFCHNHFLNKLGTKVISSRGSGECAPTSLTLRGVRMDLGPPGLCELTWAVGAAAAPRQHVAAPTLWGAMRHALILACLAGTLATAGVAAAAPGARPVPVPAAGRAVDTSHAGRVVGHGTPASCTSAAVVAAVRAGGIIRFDCGPKPVTIAMRSTAKVRNTSRQVVLDGGGRVTLAARAGAASSIWTRATPPRCGRPRTARTRRPLGS